LRGSAACWAAYAALAERKDEQLRVAAITVAELYEGVERADTPARAEKRRALIESYITRMPVVDFDAAIAREYQVATRDMRSFPRIPGLKFEQW
jgi:tRNA(fMet)-specific endonuclease VapC